VAENPILDFARIDRLRSSIPGQPAILNELIALFLDDMPLRLNAIEAALLRSDAAALALEAHALRGGGANFGARRLDELCGELEETAARGALDNAAAFVKEIRDEAIRVRDVLRALES
jgi:HPt (histidine-containing phosphotransfer) domain-containing protein